MYPEAIEVTAKREADFVRERQKAPQSHGLRAEAKPTLSGAPAALQGETSHPSESGAWAKKLHLKPQLAWGTEETLLVGLILWQFFCGSRDYLLILILLFLLLFD